MNNNTNNNLDSCWNNNLDNNLGKSLNNPNNDALERLKSKNRPTVASRDVSVGSVSVDTYTSRNLDNEVSGSTKEDGLGAEDSVNIQATVKEMLETKQSTLRLEAQISERLQALCREQGICREVLIEAMFEYCENNPEVLKVVVDAAKEKNDYRQEIANRRRAKSMIEKFGG